MTEKTGQPQKQKQETIRTPLGHARGLGSAKDGTHHWWMQRVTAVALVPLSLYWLSCLKCMTTPDYGVFIGWLGDPFVSIAALLFIFAAFYHAMLGVQVIIEDYIHAEGCKVACLLLNKLAFLFMGFACAFAIVYINFALYGRASP